MRKKGSVDFPVGAMLSLRAVVKTEDDLQKRSASFWETLAFSERDVQVLIMPL